MSIFYTQFFFEDFSSHFFCLIFTKKITAFIYSLALLKSQSSFSRLIQIKYWDKFNRLLFLQIVK